MAVFCRAYLGTSHLYRNRGQGVGERDGRARCYRFDKLSTGLMPYGPWSWSLYLLVYPFTFFHEMKG